MPNPAIEYYESTEGGRYATAIDVLVDLFYAESPCEVIDGAGNHCPEAAKLRHLPNGKSAFLCDRCFENVKQGAYA